MSAQSQLLVNKPKQVNLNMFWSGIVLIIIGTVVSCLVAVGEIFWFKYRGRVSEKERKGSRDGELVKGQRYCLSSLMVASCWVTRVEIHWSI